MRYAAGLMAITAMAFASAMAAAKPRDPLIAECARVTEVYPLLMLAAMAEWPMDCGLSDDGSDPVDCAAGETPEQKAAHARRFEIRTWQEAGYKAADDACTAWRADKGSQALREAAAAAVAEARRRDHGALAPRQGEPASTNAERSAPAGE